MGRIVIGFVAGALAVLVFHQPIIWALVQGGVLPPTSRVYNMGPLATALPPVAEAFKSFGFGGWPILFNSMFWGGLWGALFGAIHHRLPGGPLILKGIIYGLIVVVVSNWILLPLIRGMLLGMPNNPFFAGFVPQRLMAGALIQAGFGAGLGLIYGLLRRGG